MARGGTHRMQIATGRDLLLLLKAPHLQEIWSTNFPGTHRQGARHHPKAPTHAQHWFLAPSDEGNDRCLLVHPQKFKFFLLFLHFNFMHYTLYRGDVA